ncbi:uncharacterized protein BDZ83DRAFT_656558 [Colletotrichum acutatum]|uniref:Uncharacterized protein n=1 Tax=Glomerella acutata TaxID=27357 RepID=A0AAD8UCU3_GLOAC|nr:uncharacterized protein BDZ83DRAFT_656558 [Colletotrichum acutatum]KAK1712572.1 hypothetical protein BDZ83DRAFT_656558 [Colletotrichum acutatum]
MVNLVGVPRSKAADNLEHSKRKVRGGGRQDHDVGFGVRCDETSRRVLEGAAGLKMELSPVHFPECPPRDPKGHQGWPGLGCAPYLRRGHARAFPAQTVRSTEDPEIAPLRPSLFGLFFTTYCPSTADRSLPPPFFNLKGTKDTPYSKGDSNTAVCRASKTQCADAYCVSIHTAFLQDIIPSAIRIQSHVCKVRESSDCQSRIPPLSRSSASSLQSRVALHVPILECSELCPSFIQLSNLPTWCGASIALVLIPC